MDGIGNDCDHETHVEKFARINIHGHRQVVNKADFPNKFWPGASVDLKKKWKTDAVDNRKACNIESSGNAPVKQRIQQEEQSQETTDTNSESSDYSDVDTHFSELWTMEPLYFSSSETDAESNDDVAMDTFCSMEDSVVDVSDSDSDSTMGELDSDSGSTLILTDTPSDEDILMGVSETGPLSSVTGVTGTMSPDSENHGLIESPHCSETVPLTALQGQ